MGQLTSELQTAVSRLIEASRFKGKLADTAINYGTDNNTGLLLVGVGSQDKLNGGSLQKNCQSDLCKFEPSYQICRY